jgi:ferredoxin
MEISLTKLPWYAQVGAFVALAAGGVYAFYNYYEAPARADMVSRQTQLKIIEVDITKGRATARKLEEFRAQVDDLEGRLSNLKAVLPQEKDAADLLRTPADVPFDWFFGWWLPLTQRLPAWAAWAWWLAAIAIVASVAWLTRPPIRILPAKATVNPRTCTACEQCVYDCPYEAIEMVPREDGRAGMVAFVKQDLCTACGVCVNALPMRFDSTRFSRFLSASNTGASSVTSTVAFALSCWKRSDHSWTTSARNAAGAIGVGWSTIIPSSIREISRRSSINARRSSALPSASPSARR